MFLFRHRNLLIAGFAIWLAATAIIRVVGQRLLSPSTGPQFAVVFALSFPLMALLARRLCRRARLAPAEWPSGTVSLILPTLVFDPFSSAFFPSVFPNLAPEMAGAFGGWMLWCCAGALVGSVAVRRQRT